MPEVSICIPTYQQPIAFQRLITSLNGQTYRDFEIIVTDDSKDESIKNIVQSHTSAIPIKYYKNPQSLGSPENWNKALRMANGKYIKIMHHDDWFYKKDSLEKFVKLIESKPENTFAFSGSIDMFPNVEKLHYCSNFQVCQIAKFPQVLFIGNYIGAPSAVIFRNLKIEFDRQLKWLVDLEFYIRMLSMGTFSFTTEPLVAIGISKDQVTQQCINNKELNIREYKYLYLKHHLGKYKKLKKYMVNVLLMQDASYCDFKAINIKNVEFVLLKCKQILKRVKKLLFPLKLIFSVLNH
jgi:glycosyltransferase involved in cell wall biosynthesis